MLSQAVLHTAPHVIQEGLSRKITDQTIYAFKGRVDVRDDKDLSNASFKVEELEDVNNLKQKSIQEVHIELSPNFSDERDIQALKEFILEKTGNCSVYFHVNTNMGPYIVKGNNQLLIASDGETLASLSDLPLVNRVWTA